MRTFGDWHLPFKVELESNNAIYFSVRSLDELANQICSRRLGVTLIN